MILSIEYTEASSPMVSRRATSASKSLPMSFSFSCTKSFFCHDTLDLVEPLRMPRRENEFQIEKFLFQPPERGKQYVLFPLWVLPATITGTPLPMPRFFLMESQPRVSSGGTVSNFRFPETAIRLPLCRALRRERRVCFVMAQKMKSNQRPG